MTEQKQHEEQMTIILQATRELVEVIGELVAAVRENTAAIRDAAPDRWRVLTGGGSDE